MVNLFSPLKPVDLSLWTLIGFGQAMAFLLPFLLAPSLVDSKPLASILPLLRHIDSMNPQGPHFTIEAIKQYGGLYNSASYQPWPQDSASPSSSSPPAFLPSSFSPFPPSPSASSFPSHSPSA